MLKLASTQIHFVLAMVAAVGLAACGGGDEDDGGNGNTGGAGGGGGGSGTGTNELVSDFDMPNGDGAYDSYSEKPALGWKVAWFTYNDMTAGAMQMPVAMMPFVATMDATRPTGEQYVAKTNGSGFTLWGAGMGFNFAVSGLNMPPSKVDISAFKGIRFWLKVTNPAINGTVSVKLVDFDHAEVKDGGGCTKLTTPTMFDCNNTFQYPLTNATSDWKQFNIAFSEMTEQDWGQKFPMDLKEVIGFQFQVPANTTFDFAVDEFELTK